MIPLQIMSIYSAIMLKKSFLAQLPVVQKPPTKQFMKKILIKDTLQETGLDKQAVNAIYKQTSQISRFKLRICKSLLYFQRICGKDKEVRLMSQANDLMQNNLDIRSLFQVHASLNILLNLLLSERQRVLFKYQRRRSVSYQSSDSNEHPSSDDVLSFDINKLTDQDEIKKKISQLRGFKATNPLSRALLKGLFQQQPEKATSQRVPTVERN